MYSSNGFSPADAENNNCKVGIPQKYKRLLRPLIVKVSRVLTFATLRDYNKIVRATLGSPLIHGKYIFGLSNMCFYRYLCLFNDYYSVYNCIDYARSACDALCFHPVYLF